MAIGAGIVTALVGSVVSAGLAAATVPSPGRSPDLARSSRQAVLADLRTLPGRRQVEAMARLGLSGDYLTGRNELIAPSRVSDEQRALMNQAGIRPGRVISVAQAEVLERLGLQAIRRTGTAHADFTGLGDADVLGRIAADTARNELDLQREFGGQFIDEALRQEALADPEGTAARKLLAEEIRRMSGEERARPVAGKLDELVLQELQAGRELTPDTDAIAQAVAARRGATGDRATVDLTSELEQGPAAEARLRERMAHGLSQLSSGQTPEDIGYRDRQQNMANMAAFLQGRTPQSQFGALRGAQQGPAPNAQIGPLPGGDPNAAGTFAQAGLHNYNARVAQARNTVSPWFAGLNTAVRGATAAGAAGWQPFAQQS